MASYKTELASIQEMLRGFVENKTIKVEQLTVMDAMIKDSEKDQFNVLNSSSPLYVQRTMFGAIRNIHTALVGMKERLEKASQAHENPTTAEQALDVMKYLNDVIQCVDPYLTKGQVINSLEEIDKLSRKLYRKAKAFRFSQEQAQQLKEAGITEKQVKLFISGFHNNLSQELGIEEEVRSRLGDSDSC